MVCVCIIYMRMRLCYSEPAAPASNGLSVFPLVPVAGVLCREGALLHSLLGIGHPVLCSFAVLGVGREREKVLNFLPMPEKGEDA